jgi:hypothetical protein
MENILLFDENEDSIPIQNGNHIIHVGSIWDVLENVLLPFKSIWVKNHLKNETSLQLDVLVRNFLASGCA